jgi:hypothetical protein
MSGKIIAHSTLYFHAGDVVVVVQFAFSLRIRLKLLPARFTQPEIDQRGTA